MPRGGMRAWILGAVVAFAGCGADPLELSVDLRTDLVPGDAFVSVQTELRGHGTRDLTAFRGARFVDGVRVADFTELGAGVLDLQVTLFDPSRVEVASRALTVRLENSSVVTVVIAASCAGVTCPQVGDAPSLTTCSGGHCIDPTCSVGGDPGCSPPPACRSDADCASACESGSVGRCAAGECLCQLPCVPVAETCNGGDDDCDGSVDEDFDLDGDFDNCGACGHVCVVPAATPACVGGACVVGACSAGRDDCDASASNGCETTLGTASDCRSCHDTCSGGTPLCMGAAGCVSSCGTGMTLCGGACVDLDTSVSSCGACDRVCTTAHGTPQCTAGACRITSCDRLWDDCDAAAGDGCETSLATLTDCGACRTSCARAHATATCATAACRILTCTAGWTNADGIDSNGCEAPPCTGVCGDVDQDGDADSTDALHLLHIVGGTEMASACGLVDGDTIRDGHLSEADERVVLAMAVGSVGTACIPCTATCGDVNRSGTTNIVDASALMSRLASSTPYDACEWWRDDADGSGTVDSADVTRITRYDAGLDPLACLAR